MDPEPISVAINGQVTPVLLKQRGPPVAEETIVAFEKRFGYPLPKDYREFLLTYNGGRPVEGEVMGRDDQPDVPYEHGDAIECFFNFPRLREPCRNLRPCSRPLRFRGTSRK